MVNANYYYVYYSNNLEKFHWSIRESENEEFFRNLVECKDNDNEFVYGALVDTRHDETLKALLEDTKDYKEQINAIKLFSEFV